ncbi:MAG: polysaccharide deacetylase family protein [Heliobacteriaceae bacterium]|nr:polysaccharide deacetylase family protein [Heliobacteriaceae bacterium]MDD4587046.1 polysaccharide deacetylase family protein [Heliobacteriaceae bacterium]
MKRTLFIFGLVLFVFAFGYAVKYLSPAETPEQLAGTPEQPTTGPGGPDTKYGWGLVRSKNEEQPFVPQWQQQIFRDYDAVYVGPPDRKAVALTFDMGYEKEGGTPNILTTLAKHELKATFFLAGHWVKTQPELLTQLIAAGHTIGNHTWTHPSLPEISPDKLTEEIMVWHRHVYEATGYTAKYLRPPKGEFSRNSLERAKSLGYKSVFWSLAVVDWLPTSDPGQVYAGVINHLHPGAIILLHGNSPAVLSQLDAIITSIKERGYTIVPLEEFDLAAPERQN